MQRPAHRHWDEEFPIDHFCLQGREAYSESGTMVSGDWPLAGAFADAATGAAGAMLATAPACLPAQVTVCFQSS